MKSKLGLLHLFNTMFNTMLYPMINRNISFCQESDFEKFFSCFPFHRLLLKHEYLRISDVV